MRYFIVGWMGKHKEEEYRYQIDSLTLNDVPSLFYCRDFLIKSYPAYQNIAVVSFSELSKDDWMKFYSKV